MNYYEMLKLDTHATAADIEAACDALLRQWQPLVTHHDPQIAAQASEQLRTVESIRATLSDPAKRAGYDAALGVGGVASLVDPEAVLKGTAAPPPPPPPRTPASDQRAETTIDFEVAKLHLSCKARVEKKVPADRRKRKYYDSTEVYHSFWPDTVTLDIIVVSKGSLTASLPVLEVTAGDVFYRHLLSVTAKGKEGGVRFCNGVPAMLQIKGFFGNTWTETRQSFDVQTVSYDVEEDLRPKIRSKIVEYLKELKDQGWEIVEDAYNNFSLPSLEVGCPKTGDPVEEHTAVEWGAVEWGGVIAVIRRRMNR